MTNLDTTSTARSPRVLSGSLLAVFLALAIAVFAVPAASAVPCDITLQPGQNVAAAVGPNAPANRTVCLAAGIYTATTKIELVAGQALRSASGNRDVTIRSSADRIVELTGNNTWLDHMYLQPLYSSPQPTFGVLVYGATTVTVWDVFIQNTLIGIGVSGGSSDVSILDSRVYYNGNSSNGLADPAIWINASSHVEVRWGVMQNAGVGPIGDGEIACYDSPYTTIHGVPVIDSGAAGIYLVNCDYALIENNTIHRAKEWGIDVVGGSDLVEIRGNEVAWSRNGGAVFDQTQNLSGHFYYNHFISNLNGGSGSCNGINVIGTPLFVGETGNTVDSGTVLCRK